MLVIPVVFIFFPVISLHCDKCKKKKTPSRLVFEIFSKSLSGYSLQNKLFQNAGMVVFATNCVYLGSFSSIRPAVLFSEYIGKTWRSRTCKFKWWVLITSCRLTLSHATINPTLFTCNDGRRSTFVGDISLFPSAGSPRFCNVARSGTFIRKW